jgi:hypothetical protein
MAEILRYRTGKKRSTKIVKYGCFCFQYAGLYKVTEFYFGDGYSRFR